MIDKIPGLIFDIDCGNSQDFICLTEKINKLIDAANKHEIQQNIIQYKCSLSRHKAILDVLNDFEQLMSAPYDPEHLVNYISYTRNYHVSCYKQINNRLKEMEK